MQPPIFALLVGINHYASPSIPDLGGCVNDVQAIASLLQSHFEVPATQIKMLLDQQATYDAVKSTFRQHLIDDLRAFIERQQANPEPTNTALPAVLFHFSGHGSQARDESGQEPDGLDETLVCHDSRLPGVFDLKDWELGRLLDEVAQYTDNITVILDCCHSGSGTRHDKESHDKEIITHIRSCDPDLRPQPTQRPLLTQSQPEVAPDLAPTQPSTPRGPVRRSQNHPHVPIAENPWNRGRANHVLLAACRDRESAHEYIPDGRQVSPTAQRHGVLTHYLIPLLTALNAEQLPTYRELYETLRQQITRAYAQTPQCEGDWGRVLFGRTRPDRTLWLTIVDQRDGLYWIDGGLAHDIRAGVRLRVYGPTARTLTDAGEPLATIEVVETGAVQSGCEVVAGQRTLPLHARLALERPATTSTRKRVTLAIPAGMVLNAVRDRLAQDDLAAVVALVSAESGADLQLALVDDALEIQDGTGHWLGKRYALRDLNRMRRPLRAVDLDPVANDLQRIVRAQHLDLLVSADSDLADALELTLRELVYDGAGEDVLAGATVANVGGAAGANRHPQSMPIVQHNRPYVLEIHNRSEESIYVALLLRSGAWRVEQLYPEIQGAREALSPGRTLVLGLSANPQRQIRLSIRNIGPSEELTFLLIGTVAEADFESLLQQETGGNEAAEATQRVTRSFRMGGTATAADEWMSLQLKALVVRA